MSGVTNWMRHRGPELAQRLGLRRASMSCPTTSRNVFARVDGQRLGVIVRAFVVRWEAQTRCGKEPSRLRNTFLLAHSPCWPTSCCRYSYAV